MAAARKQSSDKSDAKQAPLEVLTPLAYATKLDGEVVQLRKGDVIESEKFTKESIDHLVSIGFVGQND